MDLRGQIDIFGVANVFQLLHLAQATGKLVLSWDDQEARVYFHQGNLIYARSDARLERLGEYLVRTGLLAPAQLEGAQMKAELAQGRRIGAILVESGAISEEQLKEAVRNQIKETVFALVALQEGAFAFYGQIYPENEDILLDVSLDYLMLEGLRKLDELNEPS